MSCNIFHCYNYRCFFRVNNLPVESHCECIACPNRCKNDPPVIASDRTMANKELMAYAVKFRKGN